METYDALQLAIHVETALGNAYHDALVAVCGDEAVNKFDAIHTNDAMNVLYLHYQQARMGVSRAYNSLFAEDSTNDE